MYLRTTRRKNADGAVVEYYQLAENVWDAEKGCAIAKVVYNFGRADQLDRAALQRLAKSILRVFPGEEAIAAEPGCASGTPGPTVRSTPSKRSGVSSGSTR